MNRLKRTKIRFNLGKGVNYFKWKINHPNGEVEYLHPTEVQLVMSKCELVNNKKVSEEIFNGAHKRVCAWILCEKLEIKHTKFKQTDLSGERLYFNPKIIPNWVLRCINVDGFKINKIETVDYKLYVICE
jgi:hypothetical protein